jgi:hypothetical protein
MALLPIGDRTLLTHPTLDLLHQLGLNGMAKAFGEIEASDEVTTLTHPEWLGLLLDREVSYRRDKRLLARLRYARLRRTGAAGIFAFVSAASGRSLNGGIFAWSGFASREPRLPGRPPAGAAPRRYTSSLRRWGGSWRPNLFCHFNQRLAIRFQMARRARRRGRGDCFNLQPRVPLEGTFAS